MSLPGNFAPQNEAWRDFARMFEHFPHAAACVDLKGTLLAVNDKWRGAAAAMLSGLAPTEVGANLFLLLAQAQDNPGATRLLERLQNLAEGTLRDAALDCPASPEDAGDWRRFEAWRFEPGGLILGWREIRRPALDAADIEERARVEAALRESEQRERRRSAELQAILDTAPIGLSIALDPQGARIRGNRALESMFGVEKGSELSKIAPQPASFRLFQQDRELAPHELPMQRAIRGEAVEGDILDVRREDGTRLSVFVKAMPIFDESGAPRGAVGAFMDITQIKRAEEALIENEAQFRAMFELTGVGMAQANPRTGQLLRVNGTFAQMLGYDVAELIGAPFSQFTHPDDRDADWSRFSRMARGETPVYVSEKRYVRKDGSVFWVNVTATLTTPPTDPASRTVAVIQDVTRQKQIETQLRENEERQAFLVKLLDTLRPLPDPGEVQAAACRLLGEYLGVNRVSYAEVEGETFAVRQSYLDGVAPLPEKMPVTTLGAKLLGAYRRGETVAFANVFEEPGFTGPELERFRDMRVCALASIMLERGGKWAGALCVQAAEPRVWRQAEIDLIRDVAERIWSSTERAKAVSALRESEFRLQLALDSGGIGIYEWRVDSGEMIWDRRLREQRGLASDRAVTFESALAQVHQDDRMRVREALTRALDPVENHALSLEYRVRGEDGVERWVATTGAVFFEKGRAVRMVGTAQDITARKNAEIERQKFVSLAEQSVEFIGICDLDFEPLYVNPAGLRLVGLDRKQITRTTVRDFFFPEDQPFIFDKFFPRVLREGHANVEIRFRRFDTGEALWMLYNVFYLRDANGEPSGLATVSRDITERRRAEDALKAADRRKDEFLATLAHELRNPLAPIRNAAHVLRHGGGAARSKQDLTLLSMIDRQVEHLIRLVDDLMEVSRITRGKIELKKKRVDLAEILTHAVETAQPTIDRGGHRLEITPPPETLIVEGDPVRLAQVFTNLLNNAAKYTEHGGLISIAAERRGEEAVVTVRDSGVGIPAEMLPRVFDLFTQVDRTLGRAQGGLGIGLALVRSLLELHGGTVEAQSEGLGRGSAFVVRLPALDSKNTEEPMTASKEMRAERRILVIDDDLDVADSLVMFLETFAAKVSVAYGGAEGIEALKRFRPEIVFLDLGMPGMDGYETARRIRALPEGKNVQLVALTGWGQDQVGDRAREAGFDRELTKPASLEALQELLGAA